MANVPYMSTPWGVADHIDHLGDGIMVVTTPGHGGAFVPNNMLSKVDPRGRADAKKWSGSENWYEEDCCIAWVAIAFPEKFSPEMVEACKRMNESRGF